MLVIVDEAIDHFYKKKNYDAFKVACMNNMELCEEIKSYVSLKKLSLNDDGDNVGQPSEIWFIHLNDYEKGEFKISYRTELKISKVAPLFYLEHTFEIRNRDENRLDPVLGDYSVAPYSKGQLELDEKISCILIEKGYQRLKFDDMDEVVPGFEMPEGVTIFGPQVTVEQLLFIDVLDICNRE